jgi:hypothetical protein
MEKIRENNFRIQIKSNDSLPDLNLKKYINYASLKNASEEKSMEEF